MARALVKKLVFGVAGSAFAARRKIRRIADQQALTILSLHRVAPADRSAYPPLDPGLFRELLVFLAKHFEIVVFGDLPAGRRGGKPLLILSFDDGYKDFIDYAMPILDEIGLRANQNVIPGCIASGQPPFNVLVQDFIGKAPAGLVEALDVPGFGPLSLAIGREALGNRVSGFVKSRPVAEQHVLAEALMPQILRWDDFAWTPMMTLDEVRQTAAVHELGAHSYEHATMRYETDAYAGSDAERCREYFRTNLEMEPDIYAFPNGECRPSQVEAVRRAGYETILLVGEDFSAGDRQVHRRFGIYGETLSQLRFRATGGFRRAAA